MEKEKLKFKQDAIPERFGGGYKAKMCARKTVGTLDVIGEMAAALNLSPGVRALHFKAEPLQQPRAGRDGHVSHAKESGRLALHD